MHIGIAGAGILGRLVAFELLQTGHQVSIFDRDAIDDGAAASFTAAGMLTPFSEVESAEWDIFELGMQSLALWPQILANLDQPVPFIQNGSLVVAHQPDMSDLINFRQQLDRKNVLNGFDPYLNTSQLHQREPELSQKFKHALYLPQEAWICPQSCLQALAQALLHAGISWHDNSDIEKVEAGQIKTADAIHTFDHVIDCRGIGAKNQVSHLRGVRGELIWLQAPEVKLKHMVRLMHPRYRLYLVPRFHDDIYVLGATQIENEDYSPMSVRSSLELLSAVYSLHSGFAEARVIEMKTNCRPAFRDNLPRIDITDDRLISANGLFRHGYLLAPVVARNVAQYLNKQTCSNKPLFHKTNTSNNNDIKKYIKNTEVST